jgi:PP-loop superfamily ATP-utilizing enzyme
MAARDVSRAARSAVRSQILKGLKDIGFTHVAVDLEGYVQGSLNRALTGKGAEGSRG